MGNISQSKRARAVKEHASYWEYEQKIEKKIKKKIGKSVHSNKYNKGL